MLFTECLGHSTKKTSSVMTDPRESSCLYAILYMPTVWCGCKFLDDVDEGRASFTLAFNI
jgi:hypothetical protein